VQSYNEKSEREGAERGVQEICISLGGSQKEEEGSNFFRYMAAEKNPTVKGSRGRHHEGADLRRRDEKGQSQ